MHVSPYGRNAKTQRFAAPAPFRRINREIKSRTFRWQKMFRKKSLGQKIVLHACRPNGSDSNGNEKTTSLEKKSFPVAAPVHHDVGNIRVNSVDWC